MAELIGASRGSGRVLGGLSNLGVAWVGPGAWEQRNDGHLLVGELGGGPSGYGDARPSMLQDLERGRPTEIEFVNGHVVERGQAAGLPAPVNRAVVEVIRALSRGEGRPEPAQLQRVARLAAAPTPPASP